MCVSGKLSSLILVSLVLATVFFAKLGYGQSLLFFGRVTDTQLNPVKGAEVAVFSNNLLVTSVTTDKDGNFNLRIPAGTYVLRVYLKGYAPRQILLVATQEKAGSLGTIVLEPAISIYAETTQLTVYQGDFLNFTIRVSNKGLDPLTVYFKLEKPESWVGYIALSGGLRVDNIVVDAGAERAVFLNLRVPLNASGVVRVSLEASWSNLSSVLPFVFTVQPKKWNIVEFPAVSIGAYPGAQLRIPMQVTNPFSVDMDFLLSASVPQGWVATIIDANSLSVSALALPPRASKQLFLILYVPPGATVGKYPVYVYADSAGSRYIAQLEVSVESRFDLLNLTLASTRLNLTGGTSSSVPVIVRNDGNMPTVVLLKAVTSTPELRLTFSVSGQPGGSFYLLPGETRQVNLLIDALQYITPGTYEVRVYANGTTSSAEKVLLVEVTGVRRVEVVNSNFLVVATPGSAALYRIYINNTGTYQLNSVTLRVDDAPHNFKVFIQPDKLTLLPGETGYFEIQVFVPSDASEGVYNLQFTVEADGVSTTRILLLWVRYETGLSFIVLMGSMVFVSFLLVFYGRRKFAQGA
ncbi:NEW3 domain-containing protein [Infirmifilum sp. SLHALR2]